MSDAFMFLLYLELYIQRQEQRLRLMEEAARQLRGFGKPGLDPNG